MRPAMDSALKNKARWAVLGAGLALTLVESGCAKLQEFRESDRPLLGSLSKPKTSDSAQAPTGDLYAQSLKKGPSGATLARRDPAPAEPTPAAEGRDLALPPSGASERVAAGALNVALQPPVVLPAASGGGAERGLALNQTKPEARASRELATAKPTVTLESVVAESRAKLETLTTYQVLLTGRERVGDQLQPEEDMLLSIRRDPKAVRLEWTGSTHKGREVIYSAAEHGGLMHVNMADSVVPVPRLSIPPNSPLAMRNSRHPITEAGFDTILRNVESSIERGKAGDPQAGKVSYAGKEQPEPLERPCHKIVRVTPSGETWLVYIDPESKLPALVQANAANGDLQERYVFRNPQLNVAELARADAFDPNGRWGQPKGLFSRLARSAGNPAPAANSVTR